MTEDNYLSEEIVSKMLDKIDRVEAHEIRPGDIICIFIDAEDYDQAMPGDLVKMWEFITEGKNEIAVFIGGMRIEVKRPVE